VFLLAELLALMAVQMKNLWVLSGLLGQLKNPLNLNFIIFMATVMQSDDKLSL
jgi:hypothetical protein